MIGIEIEHFYGNGADIKLIEFIGGNLLINFPNKFIELIKLGDQIVPKKKVFKIKDNYLNKLREVEIGSFLSFNPKNNYNIIRRYFLAPDFFPRTLVPFAEVGNGDLICFDYSVSGLDDVDPPIVYWIHDNPEGYEIADVAINFQEFINSLKSEEEAETANNDQPATH